MEATNCTFRELEAYAKAQHAGHTNSAFGRHRLVPTALAVAGSMNAADHAGTFSALSSFLRAKVMLPLTRRYSPHAACLDVRPAYLEGHQCSAHCMPLSSD